MTYNVSETTIVMCAAKPSWCHCDEGIATLTTAVGMSAKGAIWTALGWNVGSARNVGCVAARDDAG